MKYTDLPNKHDKDLNWDKQIIKEIYPEKYKGVLFEGLPHYLHYPKKGNRIILIATFEYGNNR